MTENKRKNVLIDRQIQLGIVVRILFYAGFSLMFVTLPIAFLRTWFDPSMMWAEHLMEVWRIYFPILICVAALIPFAIMDILKFSNRFVGPANRIRMEMEKFQNGEEIDQVVLREKDFWHDLSGQFNILSKQLCELKRENVELTSRLAKK